ASSFLAFTGRRGRLIAATASPRASRPRGGALGAAAPRAARDDAPSSCRWARRNRASMRLCGHALGTLATTCKKHRCHRYFLHAVETAGSTEPSVTSAPWVAHARPVAAGVVIFHHEARSDRVASGAANAACRRIGAVLPGAQPGSIVPRRDAARI